MRPVPSLLQQVFYLVVVRSWLQQVSHSLGLLVLAVKDPYLPLKVSKTLGLTKVVSLKVVVLSMVSWVRRCPGPPWLGPEDTRESAAVDMGSATGLGSVSGRQVGHTGSVSAALPVIILCLRDKS